MKSRLPYSDTKPEGAADFYFGINATFRFIINKYGRSAWIRYLREMGRGYFAPVNEQWAREGLPGVAAYWKEFFDAEPGANVSVIESENEVIVEVHQCPAISHLRSGDRKITNSFCQHCYYLNNARAEEAGLSMMVEGGAGSCTHRYGPANALKQEMSDIKEVE